MDACKTENLDQLLDEVFYREDRYCAELRLYPDDAEKLVRQYQAQCRQMDGHMYPDGKMWYLVWLTE